MVKTFLCPKDTLKPNSDARRSEKYRGGDEQPARRRRNVKTTVQQSDRKEREDEVKGLMSDVKEVSSASYTGQRKKKHREDVLTKLGVEPTKQQTMPMKMALGIRDGRRKRMVKQIERSKESGVVLNSSMTYKAMNDAVESSSSTTQKRKREREDRRGGLDIGTKHGVLRLKRSRLSPGLVK